MIDRIIARLRFGWTKGAYARDCLGMCVSVRDRWAVCWCATGAFLAEKPSQEHYKLGSLMSLNLYRLNDDSSSVEHMIAYFESFRGRV